MLDKLEWWPISEAAKKIGTEESIILLMADQGLFTLYARVGANDDIQGNEVFVKDTALEDASLFSESVNAKKYLGLSPLPPALLNGESIEIHSGLDPDDEDRIVLFRYLNPIPQRVRDEVRNGRPLQIVHLGFIDDITGDTDIIDRPLECSKKVYPENNSSYEFTSITVTPKDLYIRKRDAVKHMVDSSLGDTDFTNAISSKKSDRIPRNGREKASVQAFARVIKLHIDDIIASEIVDLDDIKTVLGGIEVERGTLLDWIKGAGISQPSHAPSKERRKINIKITRQ